MGDEVVANKILGRLGEKAGRATNQNGQIAHSFLEDLQELIRNETGILKGATYMHAGSAYEGLSVNAEADFDIPLILSGPGERPFLGKNFKIQKETQSKSFLLKWNKKPTSEYGNKYYNNGYLCSKALLNDAFERLVFLISSMSGWNVETKRGLAALVLKINSGGSTVISMDLVPQIAFRCWDCPDLVPLHRLPETLQRYVVHLQNNGSAIFAASLTVPRANRNELCSISFSMLEKEFLNKEENVRDIVRLVKLIGECKDWKKKYYLKSFQLKRLAIKHVEQLKISKKWEGVKLLLNYVFNDLQDNTIEGFFMKSQVIYKGSQTKVDDLRSEINEVKKWSPKVLLLQAFGISEIGEEIGVVNQIMGHIDATATVSAKSRKKIVDEFLVSLIQLLTCETGVLRGATIMHAGSSYEGLVVWHETDFDICIVLGSPFTGNNFKAMRDKESKLFRLQWLSMPSEPYIKYYSADGYLKAKLLQNELLDRLENLAKNVKQRKGWKIDVKKQLLANKVEIKCVCGTIAISMDIAPQIGVRKWECPDIVELSRLPAGLRSHVELLEDNSSPIFFYSLDAPENQNNTSKGELCQVSFSMLEKKFLQENCKIRDMVRLVKVVAFLQNWKMKYGLTLFPLKRLAIKHMEEINRLDTWPGYQRLLTHLFNDLQDMSIKGFFIQDQDISIGGTHSTGGNFSFRGNCSTGSLIGHGNDQDRPHSVDRFKTEIHEFRQWLPSSLLNFVYEKYEKRNDGGHSLTGSCF